MKLRFIALTLVLALVGMTTGTPLTAPTAIAKTASSAALSTTPANTLSAIPISGTVTATHGTAKTGTFNGLLTIQRFANRQGHLFAIGLVNGLLTLKPGHSGKSTVEMVSNIPVALPVSSATSQGGGASTSSTAPEAHTAEVSCGILHLVLGPLSLNLLGLQVNLNQVVLDISAVPGAGNLLGNLLCAIANLLNPGLPLGRLANLLNGLLHIVRPTTPPSPFTSIPVTGTVGNAISTTGSIAPRALPAQTLQPSDMFAGLLTVQRFTTDQAGKLVAQGTLSGVTGDGKTVENAAVTLPVSQTASTASCQILNLDLAPTSLNLLGLQINLSRVVLTITAIPGTGNLLGNLLCAVAKLINPPSGFGATPSNRAETRTGTSSADLLAAALNKLVDAFKGGRLSAPLDAVPVRGTTAQGGMFSGLLNIQRFTIQNGKLVAVGTLSGVLLGSRNGAHSGIITGTPVTVPVSGTGSCSVLHLDLGPLTLSLLGVRVSLSRVVLDITAVPGPGNLLGNLLCSVANLLNGTPSGGLLDLLNGLLHLLG